MINTTGKRKDNVTYFGQTAVDMDLNDFNFPLEEKGIGKRHFMIKYHDETKKYYIKDLAEGSGTFIKITRSLKLESGHIISFGDTHMTVSIEKEIDQIILKFLEGIRANEKKLYKFSDLPITIWREESNTIVFSSINMSKKHCKIALINGDVYIFDGDGISKSTNGTWLFAEKDQPLDNNIVLKAGQSLFRVELSGCI